MFSEGFCFLLWVVGCVEACISFICCIESVFEQEICDHTLSGSHLCPSCLLSVIVNVYLGIHMYKIQMYIHGKINQMS